MEFSIFIVILSYSLFAYILNDISGHIYALSILVVASVETVIGLLILLNFINLKSIIDLEEL